MAPSLSPSPWGAIGRYSELGKETGDDLAVARRQFEEAERKLRWARAAARVAETNVEIDRRVEKIAEARAEEQTAREKLTGASDELIDAKAAISGLTAAVNSQEFKVERFENDVTAAQEAVRELERARGELRIDYWRGRWDGTESEARELAESEVRSRVRLRVAANQKLGDIQVKLSLTSTGEGAPTAEIRSALRDGSGAADEDGEGDGERSDSTFDKLADAVGDWLDTTQEQDEIAEARITKDRESRSRQLETAEREISQQREQLDIVQDAIEDTIERALKAISGKLDELDRAAEGFGADLLIAPIRPADPEDTWTWSVTRGGDGGRTATSSPTPNRSTPLERSCSPSTWCSPRCWPLQAGRGPAVRF